MHTTTTSCLTKLNYSAPEWIAEPLNSNQIIHSVFQQINGTNYMYTTFSGMPGRFCVYDLDERKLISSFETTGGKNTWIHKIDSKGIVYFISDCYFFSFNPYTAVFKKYGTYFPGETGNFVMDIDENDYLYIGSYPHAKIIRFDTKTEMFEDLGTVDSDAQYVRSIACHNGYIYAGTFGNDVAKLYRIHAENPKEKKCIPLPFIEGYFCPEELNWIYTMNMADDLLMLHVKIKNRSLLLVYDTKREQFADVGFRGELKGLYTSAPYCHKTYFISDCKLWELDTRSLKWSDCGIEMKENDELCASGWLNLKNLYPDEKALIITGHGNCTPTALYPNRKEYHSIILPRMDRSKFLIQCMENGGEDDIYLSSYAGNIAVRYDLKKRVFEDISIGQIEGSIFYHGKQYFGVYPHAWLYEYDCHHLQTSDNPKNLGRVEAMQDRPFALEAADGKIFIGTIPYYGLHNGCLCIYDVESGQKKSFPGLIKNQSIISLAYHNGRLYGSTSVHGGLGSVPVEKEAKIFCYDPETEQFLAQATLHLPNDKKALHIGQIKFDTEGRLWAVSGYTLFRLHPETLEQMEQLSFGEYPYNVHQHVWRPTYIRFDQNGYLYTNIKGIKIINPETLEFVDLQAYTGNNVPLFTIGSDQNLYYSIDAKLYKISICKEEE